MINNCLNEKLFFGDDVTIASVLTSSTLLRLLTFSKASFLVLCISTSTEESIFRNNNFNYKSNYNK